MSKLWKQLCVLTAVVFVFVAVQSQATAGNAEAGEKLYTASCASCHQAKPAKMIGKPVDELLGKMQKYKTLPNPTGKVAAMQEALKPWSDAQMTDVATYLHGLK